MAMQQFVAISHHLRGDALMASGKLEAAKAALQEALGLARVLRAPPPLLPPPPAEATHENPRTAKPGADRTAGAAVRQADTGSVGVKRTGISS